MPVKQATIGESFRRILGERKRSLGKRHEELLAKKASVLGEWSRKHRQLQAEHERKSSELNFLKSQIKEAEGMMPVIEKYLAPLMDKGAAERWGDPRTKSEILKITKKIMEEMPSHAESAKMMQGVLTGKIPFLKSMMPRVDRRKLVKGESLLAVIDALKEAEGKLKKELEALEKDKGGLREEHERRLRSHGEEMEKIKSGMERIEAGMGGLGAPGYATEKLRERPTRESRLAAFALRHAGAKPLVEAQIRRLQAELGRITPIAGELDFHKKSAKKIEEKQLNPLFTFLQKEGVLRKEDRRQATEESVKNALVGLRGKVPAKVLQQYEGLIRPVAAYAEHQKNIARIESTARLERMGELNAELQYLENIKRLMARK